MARSHTKIKSKDNILDYILLVIFIGVIIVTLYPFLNVLAISFNDPIDTMRNINFIIPRKFTWSNYTYVFQENNLFEPFAMSIVRTLIGTLTGVAATAMVAYVLSRRDFYFNKLFTVLFVITMYVSGGLVPEYLLITRTLKLGNHFLVYILPGLIWVYNIILIRSFIDGQPELTGQTILLFSQRSFCRYVSRYLRRWHFLWQSDSGIPLWIPICMQEIFRPYSMYYMRLWRRRRSRLIRMPQNS